MDNNHVRKLDESELDRSRIDQQWYVPHHPVTYANKPELRRGCNAASKYNGVSVNDKLIAGPDSSQSLVAIVSRFRQYSIPVTADIEAMFLQVKVPDTECMYLQFLRRDNPTKRVEVFELKVLPSVRTADSSRLEGTINTIIR